MPSHLIENTDDTDEIVLVFPPSDQRNKANELASKLTNVVNKFTPLLEETIDTNSFEDLADFTANFSTLLKTEVVYHMPPKKSDPSYEKIVESNERLQGRALFDRQKKFAQIIRTLKTLGLDSNRANIVDSEALTLQSITEWHISNILRVAAINDLVHCASSYRNVFQKKYATVRISQQPHIQKQVPIGTLGHLHGITEYSLHWLLKSITSLEQHFAPYAPRIKDILIFIAMLKNNQLDRSVVCYLFFLSFFCN